MTPEELKQIGEIASSAATTAVNAALKPLETQIATLQTQTTEQFKQFNEKARSHHEVDVWCDDQDKKVPLGQSAADLRRANAHKLADGLLTFAEYRQGYEAIPARIVSADRAKGDDKDGDDTGAIAKLRPTDFDKPSENDARLSAGMKQFSEDPRYAAQFAIVRDKPYAAQQDALKTIVVQRDAATN